jgi:hypothetical protein
MIMHIKNYSWFIIGMLAGSIITGLFLIVFVAAGVH